MKKKHWIYIGFVIISILIAYLWMSAYRNDSSDEMIMIDGVVDASDWDGEIKDLQGDWLFYPNQRYGEHQIYELRDLPHEWDDEPLMNESVYGYALYEGLIIGLKPNTAYGFRIYDEVTSYNLFVNDELVASNGSIDKKIPEWRPVTGVMTTDDMGRLRIFMEIGNYHYNRGGFWNTMDIGDFNDIMSKKLSDMFVSIFLFAGIFIMGVFFFGLYITHEHKAAPLYFSLFCFSISGYSLLTGQRIIHQIIPDISWHLLVRLEYLMGYMILPFFVLFVMNVLNTKRSKWFDRLLIILQLTTCMICLVLPHQVYMGLLEPYKYFGFLCAVVVLIAFIKAMIKDYFGSKYMLVSSTAVVIAMIKEVYFGNTTSYLPVATFIVVVCFSLITIEEFVIMAKKNRVLENEIVLDELTGLYNKQYLLNYIEDTLDTLDETSYLLFLDLDDYKLVNDTYGHLIGDQVLKVISSRLRAVLRSNDIIARYGGDEFVLFIHHDSVENVKHIATRLIDFVKREIHLDDQIINVGISVGICSFKKGMTLNEWIQKSDQAMYASKKDGGKGYTFCS